jgi:hypothetical protein
MPGRRGFAAFLSLAVALVGCSGRPAPAPPAAIAERLPRSPTDFALDLTVLPGRKIDALVGDDAPDGIEIVRAKYLVLADGSLRAEAGEGVQYLTRPGRVRILTMEEVADLWESLERSGFAGPRDDLYLGNPALLVPRQDEVLTVVTITSDGFTRSILDRHAPDPAAPDGTPPGPVGELVRKVASLAWFGGDAPGAIAIEPVRVDLGPNPYAVYLPAEPGRQPPYRTTPAAPALGPDTAVLPERRLPTPILGPGAGTVPPPPPPAGAPR